MSNDGNTSRRFFFDIKFASDVTGVDEEIIQRFSIILTAINASVKIDGEKFGEYAFTTARKFNTKYAWFSFSPTVHKVLVHGADIIKKAILPVGNLNLSFFNTFRFHVINRATII